MTRFENSNLIERLMYWTTRKDEMNRRKLVRKHLDRWGKDEMTTLNSHHANITLYIYIYIKTPSDALSFFV